MRQDLTMFQLTVGKESCNVNLKNPDDLTGKQRGKFKNYKNEKFSYLFFEEEIL